MIEDLTSAIRNLRCLIRAFNDMQKDTHFEWRFRFSEFTANQLHTELFKLLALQQYQAASVLLLASNKLFEKVMQQRNNYHIEHCMRLLITVLGGSDFRSMTMMIEALLERLKALGVLQHLSLQKILVGIVEYAIMILANAPSPSSKLNDWLQSLIAYLPDPDILPKLSTQYFSESMCQTLSKKAPLTLLMTTVMVSNKQLTAYLLEHTDADINVTNKIGWTALMYAASSDNVPMYHGLLEYGANRDQRDNRGRTADLIAAQYQSVALLHHMAKHGYHFPRNLTDNAGNSPLMLWFKKEYYDKDSNPLKAVETFQWLMHLGGSRAWECLNRLGESFTSLFNKKSNLPRALFDAITQSINEIENQSPPQWICIKNTKSKLDSISKKIQSVLQKQDDVDALKRYVNTEILRLIPYLHQRFSGYFHMTFGKQLWARIMQFYHKNSVSLLMHRICCLPSDKRKTNENNCLAGLSPGILYHIDSYYPSPYDGKHVAIETLYKKATNQWEALTNIKTSSQDKKIPSHWIENKEDNDIFTNYIDYHAGDVSDDDASLELGHLDCVE